MGRINVVEQDRRSLAKLKELHARTLGTNPLLSESSFHAHVESIDFSREIVFDRWSSFSSNHLSDADRRRLDRYRRPILSTRSHSIPNPTPNRDTRSSRTDALPLFPNPPVSASTSTTDPSLASGPPPRALPLRRTSSLHEWTPVPSRSAPAPPVPSWVAPNTFIAAPAAPPHPTVVQTETPFRVPSHRSYHETVYPGGSWLQPVSQRVRGSRLPSSGEPNTLRVSPLRERTGDTVGMSTGAPLRAELAVNPSTAPVPASPAAPVVVEQGEGPAGANVEINQQPVIMTPEQEPRPVATSSNATDAMVDIAVAMMNEDGGGDDSGNDSDTTVVPAAPQAVLPDAAPTTTTNHDAPATTTTGADDTDAWVREYQTANPTRYRRIMLDRTGGDDWVGAVSAPSSPPELITLSNFVPPEYNWPTADRAGSAGGEGSEPVYPFNNVPRPRRRRREDEGLEEVSPREQTRRRLEGTGPVVIDAEGLPLDAENGPPDEPTRDTRRDGIVFDFDSPPLSPSHISPAGPLARVFAEAMANQEFAVARGERAGTTPDGSAFYPPAWFHHVDTPEPPVGGSRRRRVGGGGLEASSRSRDRGNGTVNGGGNGSGTANARVGLHPFPRLARLGSSSSSTSSSARSRVGVYLDAVGRLLEGLQRMTEDAFDVSHRGQGREVANGLTAGGNGADPGTSGAASTPATSAAATAFGPTPNLDSNTNTSPNANANPNTDDETDDMAQAVRVSRILREIRELRLVLKSLTRIVESLFNYELTLNPPPRAVRVYQPFESPIHYITSTIESARSTARAPRWLATDPVRVHVQAFWELLMSDEPDLMRRLTEAMTSQVLTEEDVEVVERALRATERRIRAGLDPEIAVALDDGEGQSLWGGGGGGGERRVGAVGGLGRARGGARDVGRSRPTHTREYEESVLEFLGMRTIYPDEPILPAPRGGSYRRDLSAYNRALRHAMTGTIDPVYPGPDGDGEDDEGDDDDDETIASIEYYPVVPAVPTGPAASGATPVAPGGVRMEHNEPGRLRIDRVEDWYEVYGMQRTELEADGVVGGEGQRGRDRDRNRGGEREREGGEDSWPTMMVWDTDVEHPVAIDYFEALGDVDYPGSGPTWQSAPGSILPPLLPLPTIPPVSPVPPVPPVPTLRSFIDHRPPEPNARSQPDFRYR